MLLAIAGLIFLFGTAVGSFLNVVILRLGVSPLRGRSRCPHCGKTLEWFELIPLFSFLIQRGRCRRCRSQLSLQYPLIEFLTGALFLAIFWRLIWRFPTGIAPQVFLSGKALWIWPLIVIWWYYGSVLLAIAAYDVRKYLIPDALLFPAIIVAASTTIYFQVLRWTQPPLFPLGGVVFSGQEAMLLGRAPFGAFGSALAGILAACGLLGALYAFSKGRAMGFGDVKLGAFMGLALGWPDTLVALLVAFVTGMLWSIALMVAGKKSLKSYLPFGPFLAFGVMIAMLAGDMIMRFYFRILPQMMF
jgi:leader peptidase (prepilin peptidase)/N-methyltransferase